VGGGHGVTPSLGRMGDLSGIPAVTEISEDKIVNRKGKQGGRKKKAKNVKGGKSEGSLETNNNASESQNREVVGGQPKRKKKKKATP
jgi:hypothetical protein